MVASGCLEAARHADGDPRPLRHDRWPKCCQATPTRSLSWPTRLYPSPTLKRWLRPSSCPRRCARSTPTAFNKSLFLALLQVAQVEAEAQQLREAVIAKQNTIKSLERRVSMLELENQELQAKVRCCYCAKACCSTIGARQKRLARFCRTNWQWRSSTSCRERRERSSRR